MTELRACAWTGCKELGIHRMPSKEKPGVTCLCPRHWQEWRAALDGPLGWPGDTLEDRIRQLQELVAAQERQLAVTRAELECHLRAQAERTGDTHASP